MLSIMTGKKIYETNKSLPYLLVYIIHVEFKVQRIIN